MNAARDSGGTGMPTKAAADGPALLFEVAWEVCSQVGGIYTVLRSKAPILTRRWGDNYFLIGPYQEVAAKIELEPQAPTGPLYDVMEEFRRAGIMVHYGRWLIQERPQAILIDPHAVSPRLGEIKYYLWKDNGINSPAGDAEFDEVVGFGSVVADFLMALQRRYGERPFLAHFHEWQGGAALPMLRHRQSSIATVFTTHATLAGRNLCAANADIYEHLDQIDAGAAANEHGFGHRHALEGAAAQAADVFTTVSGITALEAERFLGRRPDVLLPNGLNVERFAAPHEFQVLHRSNKEAIHEFVMGHFFPNYTFDLDKTIYVFTAGRYEFRNKGLDVFIEALHELNLRLRAEGSDATVVAFIVTRAPRRALNVETLNRQAMFNEMREACEGIKEEMGRRLFRAVATGRLPDYDELIHDYEAVRLKRMMQAWRAGAPPTIVTHDLLDDANDPVLRHLRHRHLVNLEGDRVKVVFHPEFMSVTSPLLGLDYDQFVRGCHVGVFPSYYEPWGYTPLECLVRGIPAITSDLSGFGHYVMQNFPEHEENGIYVTPRRSTPYHVAVQHVADRLHMLATMNRRERITLRNRVEGHAEHFDWSNLIGYYVVAHKLALQRRFPGKQLVPGEPDIEALVARSEAEIKALHQPRTARRRSRTPAHPKG